MWFKKYKFELLLLFFFSVVYFVIRLYHIMSLPLFTDEAIYTRWSQIARFDPNWRFISLTDGKQPMFVWLDLIVMHVVKDPLLSGRLVSVGAGFLTMIGLFFLGKEIFRNRWVGVISSVIYALYPFGLVYDRMALYDSLVGTFAVWGLYLEVILVRKLNANTPYQLGLVTGGGALTKSNAFFTIPLSPVTLLLFDWRKQERMKRLVKWFFYTLIAGVLTVLLYSILRLSPFFHMIGEKNEVFVYSLHDWLQHPLRFFVGNLSGQWDWLITYLTWPFFVLILASFLVNIKFFREKIVLVAYFIAPFIFLAMFGKVLYPRFILFMTLYLLPLIAFSIYKLSSLKTKWIFLLILLAIFYLPIRADYYILSDFARAPIPGSDLTQYINDWPAGGGIRKIIPYLQRQSVGKKIYVASEGTFGSLPTYAVEIYLGDNKNVDKRGIWPLPPDIPQDLVEKAKIMPTYFIFNQTQDIPKTWPIRLIGEYRKGVGNSFMRLYQVE